MGKVIGLRPKKQSVVALAMIAPNGKTCEVEMPEGALGMLFIFESAEAARAHFGQHVPVQKVEGNFDA